MDVSKVEAADLAEESLHAVFQGAPKMPASQTGSNLGVSRPTSRSPENEDSEESVLDSVSTTPAGGTPDAARGQCAVPDGPLRAEQQTPPGRQHDPGARPAHGPPVPPLPGLAGHRAIEEGGGGQAQGSPEDCEVAGVRLECNITVLPEGYRQTLQADSRTSVEGFLEKVAQQLGVPVCVLVPQQAGQELAGGQLLADLCAEGYEGQPSLELDIMLDFSRTAASEESGSVPEQSEAQEDQPKRTVIEIDESRKTRKPFLGGYRNKQTGVEYLNAAVQAEKASIASISDRKLSRDTQTYVQKNVAGQSRRETATQMARSDLLLNDSRDKVVAPRAYEDSEHWERRRDHAVVTLQRFWRGWLARRRVAELREREEEKQRFLIEEGDRRRQATEAHRRAEIDRRLQPRTTADFDILYSELEAWRMQETRKIKEHVPDENSRKPALRQLLHKETKLLQTIDRLKLAAGKENRSARISRTLASMAAPKQWELQNGNKVEVQTPLTVRAAELMQLYHGLRLRHVTPDQRLDIVQHIKWTVHEFDCPLTRELLELLGREEDLLQRGRPTNSLEGLRRRIANLFLQARVSRASRLSPCSSSKRPSSIRRQSGSASLCLTSTLIRTKTPQGGT